MIVLIDNGHGSDTPGKCSPDGRYHEWEWTRIVARHIVAAFAAQGVEAQLLVPEDNDISLAERARRVNDICGRKGKENVILLSIHSNAAGNGEWKEARGWCAYTSRGKTEADTLATCLYEQAKETLAGHKLRTDYSDGDPDWEAGFYMLAKTKCPAVLTENFFHDNREDVEFITSKEGMFAVVNTHVKGVMRYINSRAKARS